MLVGLMRYMAARYPRHVRTGIVAKCRDGTWVSVCEVISVISRVLGRVVLYLLIEEMTL
jgi:hypothetical protein